MTNIFQGNSIFAQCVCEWDRLLRIQEWVNTESFASIFNYNNLSWNKISTYEKAIKKAKKEIGRALAERGMVLREQKDPLDNRRILTAYPTYNKDPLHDLRIMAIVEDAMLDKHALQLTYSPSYHEEEEHIFHAQYQRVYNGRHFLYGVYENEEENQDLPFVTLAVDRIVEARIIKEIPYHSGDPKKYEEQMKYVLGASPNFRNSEVKEVVLRTHDPKVHKLLLTRPLHHSIREKQPCGDGQTGILTLYVQNTLELSSWILHYGTGLEVIAPQELRDSIAKGLSKMVTYYSL